ncbi:MAG: LysE family translocator [Pseudomonadota bacterium]
MLAFAVACFLIIATPGPGVLSVAGVGSGYGFKIGSLYLWGLCLGNILVCTAVVTGLAAALFSVPYVREVLLTACVAYMIYLAAKIALAGSRINFIESARKPGFRDGVALQAINPKAYMANTFLFTGFGFLPNNVALEVTLKYVIWVLIWIPMHFAWLQAGVILRRLNLPDHKQRLINFAMATSMLVVVGLAFLST